jgi:hypothetical protein
MRARSDVGKSQPIEKLVTALSSHNVTAISIQIFSKLQIIVILWWLQDGTNVEIV